MRSDQGALRHDQKGRTGLVRRFVKKLLRKLRRSTIRRIGSRSRASNRTSAGSCRRSDLINIDSSEKLTWQRATNDLEREGVKDASVGMNEQAMLVKREERRKFVLAQIEKHALEDFDAVPRTLNENDILFHDRKTGEKYTQLEDAIAGFKKRGGRV